MKWNRFWLFETMLTTVLVILIAVAPVQAKTPTTVTAVMQSGLRVLDPVYSNAFITRDFGYMIYDTLLGVDKDFNIRPQMADWSVSEDGKIYTFTLRDGLMWHDGTPVTSDDCIASIKRWMSVDSTGQVLSSIVESYQVVNANVFKVNLKKPTGLLLSGLSKLSSRPAFMMPERVAKTPATEPVSEHIGSGPFIFVEDEFRPGTKVVFKKNEQYIPRAEAANWTAGGKKVNVDRVVWLTMPDAMTSVNALLNDEVDYIQQVPYDLLPLLNAQEDIDVEVTNELGNWTYLRFNHLYPPFDNPDIREAAMLAINQESVLQALVGNDKYYQTCAAVFGCGNPYESDYRFDDVVHPHLKEARSLLKDAGYENTPVVVLHPTDMWSVSPQPVVVADGLRKAGFNVQVKDMDWQSVVVQQQNQSPPSEGGWNIFATYSTLSTSGNPFGNTTVAANGRDAWAGWPDVPQIEKLRKKYAFATSEDEQKEIAKKIDKLSIDLGVVVPLGQFTIPAAYQTTISHIPHSPVTVFWSVEKAN